MTKFYSNIHFASQKGKIFILIFLYMWARFKNLNSTERIKIKNLIPVSYPPKLLKLHVFYLSVFIIILTKLNVSLLTQIWQNQSTDTGFC